MFSSSLHVLSLQEAALSDGKTAPCIVWSVCLLWLYRRDTHILYAVNDHQRGVQYDPINSRGPPSARVHVHTAVCAGYRQEDGCMLLYFQPSDACKHHHLHVFISSCLCGVTYFCSLRPESLQQLKTTDCCVSWCLFVIPAAFGRHRQTFQHQLLFIPLIIFFEYFFPSTLNPVLEAVLDLLVLHISNENVLLTVLQRRWTKTLNHASR